MLGKSIQLHLLINKVFRCSVLCIKTLKSSLKPSLVPLLSKENSSFCGQKKGQDFFFKKKKAKSWLLYRIQELKNSKEL